MTDFPQDELAENRIDSGEIAANFTEEHLLAPRRCKECGEFHFKGAHADVIDFFKDFEDFPGQAAEMLAKLDDQMFKEYVPSTEGFPGRSLKYVTPEQRREGAARRQRAYRERQKARESDADDGRDAPTSIDKM